MMTVIHDKVEAARQGTNPNVIAKLDCGWAVIGDVQPLAGYCMLLPDPVVESLNAMAVPDRIVYCRDMARVGDALLTVTDAYRINYEIWCNVAPALHTHITPRYISEPDDKRPLTPREAYDWNAGRPADPAGVDRAFMQAMHAALTGAL